MGIEGHESPRDVASEDKKHPWEIFPKDETSANLSEKEREQLKKKNENKAKRKMHLSKTKKWVNTHHILLLSIAIAAIILISGGVFAIFKLNEKKISDEKPAVEDDAPLILYGFPDDFNVKDAITAFQAFDYANTVVGKIAIEGVSDPRGDTAKIEDNMDLFIEGLSTDYEKLYFRIYTAFLLSTYENPTRGQYLLETIEYENKNLINELDKNQRYMYYKAYEAYYYALGDNENHDLWQKKIQNDPEFIADDYVLLNEETGEVITDEEIINLTKEVVKKAKEERENK